MHPEEIKAAIRMRGFTSASIADELEVTRSAVSAVINGAVSCRIRTKIAQVLGKPADSIWPAKKASGLRREKSKAAKS